MIAGGHFDVKLDPKAPLKDPGTYRIVNQPVKRPDLPAKMTGRHTYVHDLRVPNMLHARVVRPPAIGATLAEVDESSIANIPGARVVRIKDFLAVVAEREWNAVRAAKALRVRWTGGGGLPGFRARPRRHAHDRDRQGRELGQAGRLRGRIARRRPEICGEL